MTTVLVVDDSTANRRLLHTLLSLRGHDVIEADNGGQALAIARQASPEVVVADVFAPHAGGHDLVRELREDPQTAGIPVVAYGCDDERGFGPIAERYHVDRVVPRTSDPGPLLDAIESLLTGPERSGHGGIASGTGGIASGAAGRNSGAPFRQGEPLQHPEHAAHGGTSGQMEAFRQVLDLAPVGVALGSATGHASYVNPALAEITGIPLGELLGTGWLACVNPHRRRQVMDAVTGAVVSPPTAGTTGPATGPAAGDATGSRTGGAPGSTAPGAPGSTAPGAPGSATTGATMSATAGVAATVPPPTPAIGPMVSPMIGPIMDAVPGTGAGTERTGAPGEEPETRPSLGGADILHYRDRVEFPGRRYQVLDVHVRRTAGAGPGPAGFVAFVVDVTDTVQSEERRHAESERHARFDSERAATRMESLRRFAGSVAHGYNNALAVILSYGEFLRERVTEAHNQGRIDPSTSHDLNADLSSIMEAGQRAAHLTQQLQSFGHRGRPPAPTLADLNASLEPELAALRRRLGPDIIVHLNLAENLRPVVADTEQIGEVIRNLTENALDAMPDGGELMVETAIGDPAMGPERLAQDGHVRLTVRDTGQGMPSHVAQHAIEPFFSTKPDSPGGGLGLTAVYGIAHQSGGDVVIESASGAGTSVHVLFPVAAPTGALPPDAEAGTPAITETILVVDDEEPVRRLVHRILTKAGYQVLTAEDAAEAMDVARAHPGPVHCLITDLAMPGLPGTELTRRLRAQRPELAVLYMSGYAEPLLHHVGNADNRTNLLPKPFSRVELLTAVRATIHEHRAARPR